ncbi:hypothetical protein AB0G79_09120 [Streptomyces sp. NPDC020807]|uniref:hypothetical protein n=1 Tax=Streptomyces sp. NPDC020807 TaxID=3155119 RepID=UPI0033C6C20C
MNASLTALLIAVVGVAGTLGAALLTQSRAERTKLLELRAAAEQRREEHAHAERSAHAEQERQRQRESLERRRACYIALNTTARHFLTSMTNHLHAVRRGEDEAASLETLEAARGAFRDCFAESQMIAPAPVRQHVGQARQRLLGAYGSLRTYLDDPDAHAAELAAMEDALHQDVWPFLGAMKDAMRRDLGVDD